MTCHAARVHEKCLPGSVSCTIKAHERAPRAQISTCLDLCVLLLSLQIVRFETGNLFLKVSEFRCHGENPLNFVSCIVTIIIIPF
jgi:hypothetical protein